MDEKQMMEHVGKVVGLLKPLTSVERQRIVSASLALLGDVQEGVVQVGNDKKDRVIDTTRKLRTEKWLKDNEISEADVEQLFHIDGDRAEIIDVPGKDNKEKTINAYILSGISSLLTKGEIKFSDKAARELCMNIGCYSSKHHAEYIKEARTQFIGTKDSGWSLTATGLKNGALLIKPKAIK